MSIRHYLEWRRHCLSRYLPLLLVPVVTSLTASCPALTLSNGDITYIMNTSPIPVGTLATHSCSDSFVLSGDATRRCTGSASGGMWSGLMLTCIGKHLLYTSHI